MGEIDKKVYTPCVQIYLFLHLCLPIPHSSAGTAEPPLWHRHPWPLLPAIWWLLVTSGAVLEPAHLLSLSGFIFISDIHIIRASFSISTVSPLRGNMASLLVPHNAVLKHLPLLEHFFGCYLPHIVTENTSLQEIQSSPQRKFWNGSHGDLYLSSGGKLC